MIDIAGAVTTDAIDDQTRDQPEPAHRAAGVGPVAAHYGDHFKPTPLLKEMAAKGETFYGRFDPYGDVEKAA